MRTGVNFAVPWRLVMSGSVKNEEFDELVRQTRLTAASKEAARRVLVDDVSQVDAAGEAGISKQQLNRVVSRVRKLQDEKKLLESARITPGGDLVAVVNASYAVAVSMARAEYGDNVRIQDPEHSQAMLIGPVVGRTEFHIVQALGRDAVAIHDLAKLDRAPALRQVVCIEYALGRATVQDRTENTKTQTRGR